MRARCCSKHFITHTKGCKSLQCDVETILSYVKASVLFSLLLHNMSSDAAQVYPSSLLIFLSLLQNFRFLHDKNSREFLYYRKKVAEIRKESQKLQTTSQKGRWVEGGGRF